MIVAFTGHRDIELSEELLTALGRGIKYFDPDEVWCGMAKGFDLTAGMVADNYDIPVNLAYIFRGTSAPVQEPWHSWFCHLSSKYFERIHFAVESYSYERWQPLVRNTYMLDRSDAVLSCWSGTRFGGTWDTVRKAMDRGMMVYNIDPKTFERRLLGDEDVQES